MKISTRARIGLIVGILLLFGLLVLPASASEDTSWFTPAPLDDVMAWFKTTAQHALTTPADNTGAPSLSVPSYEQSEDTAWITPVLPEQAIASGNRIAKQAAAAPYPSKLSQADRIRLFRVNNTRDYVPVPPGVTMTPVPTRPSRTSYGERFPTQRPISMPTKPYYPPSTIVTVVPTGTPTPGNEAPGQKAGVSVTELNLQGKYVKITNTGMTPVVMTGWKITNSRGNALTFIDFPLDGGSTFTYVLDPYSTLTVYFGKEGMVTNNVLYYPPGVDFWNQQGDTASLYNQEGQLAGRVSNLPSTIVTVVPTGTPTPGNEAPGQKAGVSVTELNLQGKYVKITNTGTTPVVMTGWKITNSRGNALTFIDFPLDGGSTFTYVLNPYSTLTVYFGKEGMVTNNVLYYPPGVDFWNQQGDTASLYNPQGQLAGRISA